MPEAADGKIFIFRNRKSPICKSNNEMENCKNRKTGFLESGLKLLLGRTLRIRPRIGLEYPIGLHLSS